MAVAPLLALGGALLTQHVGGMMPCAWCVMPTTALPLSCEIHSWSAV